MKLRYFYAFKNKLPKSITSWSKKVVTLFVNDPCCVDNSSAAETIFRVISPRKNNFTDSEREEIKEYLLSK